MSMTSCHSKEIRSLTPSGINVNNMAWLAVDKDGTEKVFDVQPFRGNTQEDRYHVWGTYAGEDYAKAVGMPIAFRHGMRAAVILSFGRQCIL